MIEEELRKAFLTIWARLFFDLAGEILKIRDKEPIKLQPDAERPQQPAPTIEDFLGQLEKDLQRKNDPGH